MLTASSLETTKALRLTGLLSVITAVPDSVHWRRRPSPSAPQSSAPIWPMLPANSESAMNAVGVGSWIIMFCSPAILSMSGQVFQRQRRTQGEE